MAFKSKQRVLGGAILVIILTVVIGYGGVYQPYIAPYHEALQEGSDLEALNERVDDQSTFSPPDDGILTSDQVERYMRVQSAIEREVGHQIGELEREIASAQRQTGTDLSVQETAEVLREAVGRLAEAKEVQVEALNQQNFSLSEYRWVQQELYRAIGHPLPRNSLTETVTGLNRASGDGDRLSEAYDRRDVSSKNQKLARGYADRLEQKAPLAFLGL